MEAKFTVIHNEEANFFTVSYDKAIILTALITCFASSVCIIIKLLMFSFVNSVMRIGTDEEGFNCLIRAQ